jgi:hypothetical protein
MRKAIAMALIVQSIYKFAARKPWISAFRGKKTEQFYLARFKFYSTFLQISQEPVVISIKFRFRFSSPRTLF